MNLDKMELGRKCKVIDIQAESSMLRRFLDIGIIPGATIKKVLIGPFRGISAYYIMGTTIAIRDSDAEGIKVEYAEV